MATEADRRADLIGKMRAVQRAAVLEHATTAFRADKEGEQHPTKVRVTFLISKYHAEGIECEARRLGQPPDEIIRQIIKYGLPEVTATFINR